MDSNNWREQRREQRQRWRDERWKLRQEIRDRYHVGAGGGGRIWVGIFILVIGIGALLKVALFPIPVWVVTWQMLLIVLGFFMGVRHNFRGIAWFILMLIGGIFMVDEFYPDFMLHKYLWPMAIILVGLFFIFRPHRRGWYDKKPEDENVKDTTTFGGSTENLDEEMIDSTSVFGGTKKKILSKNFKGGDITNIFGGTEIDLSQADIVGEARLELTQIFGGTKLIIPANWKLIMKNAAILGGIEDKRPNQPYDPNKVLILTGTSMFGGIEIRSY